ncbi:MAG: Crp/Fnr family transcriptional regulator [Acidobacteriia bacterium]|nr:Crp/Fnr family transcriptional regulator [Terriglobia bacterium]
MPNGAKLTVSREIEDALMYLPRKGVTDYRKGQVIFDENQPSRGLHLVVQGRVKVAVPLEDGTQTVVDIFTTDDFFGESSLLGAGKSTERAVALDNVTLMSWTGPEIEEQVERQPRLGIALLQMLVKRGLDYEERLQSFALDKTPERVVRALLRFAERLGVRTEDGSVKIPPLTHQVLSEYVGTSREIVTFQMNYLRQKGYLRYSRKGIQVYVDSLREYLDAQRSHESGWPAGEERAVVAAERNGSAR